MCVMTPEVLLGHSGRDFSESGVQLTSCVDLFSKLLLTTCYVPSTVLDADNDGSFDGMLLAL